MALRIALDRTVSTHSWRLVHDFVRATWRLPTAAPSLAEPRVRCQLQAMTIELNHTIVHAKDPQASASFLSAILGLPSPRRLYHFWVVQTANRVSLDYLAAEPGFDAQHLAFLVSEAEFDEIFARIREQKLEYWADPGAQRPGEINRNDGGRGVYFQDPSGHYLEILTRPYGAGAAQAS